MILGMHGGPPCNMWSKALYHTLSWCGPKPCRSRQHLFGLPNLSAAMKARCDRGTCYFRNTVLLALKMPHHRPRTLEHPADPGCEPYPSAWIASEIRDFLDGCSGETVTFDMCRFGWDTPKPTTLGGNLDDMGTLALRCSHGFHRSLKGLEPDSRSFKTAAAQRYTSAFCAALGGRFVATIGCRRPS